MEGQAMGFARKLVRLPVLVAGGALHQLQTVRRTVWGDGKVGAGWAVLGKGFFFSYEFA